MMKGYTHQYLTICKGMLMDGIDERNKQKIVGLIGVLLPNAKIYLFGSRARGDHSERSDIDLALDTGEKIERSLVGEIRDVLEATNIINSMDVVDLNGAISPMMREAILKERVLWKA